MKSLGFLLNGVLLAGVVTFGVFGSDVVASPVVDGSELADLEASVASTQDPDEVAKLASKYLEKQQPGLAQAVIDAAPEASSVRLSHVKSRVALAQGRVDEALAISDSTLAACEAETSRCSSFLYARTVHQNHVLSEMQRAGVQDPAEDPERARRAVASAVREVRLAGAY